MKIIHWFRGYISKEHYSQLILYKKKYIYIPFKINNDHSVLMKEGMNKHD